MMRVGMSMYKEGDVMPQLACQTITWGPERLLNDYQQILADVKNGGFEGIETNLAVLLKHQVNLPNWLRDTGLRLVAVHYGADSLMNMLASERGRVLEWQGKLKTPYFLVSSHPAYTEDNYRQLAKFMTEFAAKARNWGIQVCFHHHDWELKDPQCYLERFLQESGPEVGIAADFGWVLRSGFLISDFLKLVGPRLRYVHLKDSLKGEWTELGCGELAVNEVLKLLIPLNLPWWTSEQDTTTDEPKNSVELNAKYLRNFLVSRGGR